MEVQEVEMDRKQYAHNVVAIAISGSKSCKQIINWALDKFNCEGDVTVKLLHVRPKLLWIPTAMGKLPISGARDEVVEGYTKEVEQRTNLMLLPFKKFCTQRKVEAEIIVSESDDVPLAISEEVKKLNISRLVIGSSRTGIISRGRQLCPKIAACAPKFCTVYVVSGGKLSSVHAPKMETEGSSGTKSGSSQCVPATALSLPDQQIQYCLDYSTSSHPLPRTTSWCCVDSNLSRISSQASRDSLSSYSSCLESLHPSTAESSSESSSILDNGQGLSLCDDQYDVYLEAEKLRVNLQHAQEMWAKAHEETASSYLEASALSFHRMNVSNKRKELNSKEEIAWEEAKIEKEKREAAEREAKFAIQCAEKEVVERKAAENRAQSDAKEVQLLKSALDRVDQRYQKFTWDEIVEATSSFSDTLRIGLGSCGAVYKCSLRGTTAAVKVLQVNEGLKTKHFQQEVEVLCRICHPHVLLLIGACPENGCLVYEYMENGSLEDRLFRKGNTPSLKWFDRFRIAWEVASALLFLHNAEPNPIIHRDLKPANILLDHNLVSKIGDAGVSLLVPTDTTSLTNKETATALVGTFCYIDPEYQRSGTVTTKSDVYALGIVILQLLTAKTPIGLTYLVETALAEGNLKSILDGTAGEWPLEETRKFVLLGLQCAELRRSDRPDLETEVLPLLAELKSTATNAVGLAHQVPPPRHFIRLTFQDVMRERYVASDVYTYDRSAIKRWLNMSDIVPLKNLRLSSKKLVLNYALLAMICKWCFKNYQVLQNAPNKSRT